MDIRDRRGLKTAAGETLAGASSDPRKLILIHTGAALALSLVLSVLDFMLEEQIGGTGGLSGMGLRAILSTMQSMFQLVQMVLIPFWQIGWLFAALRLSRGERTEPGDLLEGFRRFFPVLRLYLLQGVLYVGIAMVCCYIASIVFVMTPWSEPLVNVMTQLMESGDLTATEAAIEEVTAEVIVPMMAIFAVIFLAAAAPFFYRFRMAKYLLMDGESRAMKAMRESWRMMKGNAIAMLKLDISFWWFYVLDLLVTVVAYLDLILPAAGVTLPWPSAVTYFGALVLYSGFQLLLYWQCKPQVDVTYAKAYEVLSRPEEPKMQNQPLPPKQPWTY